MPNRGKKRTSFIKHTILKLADLKKLDEELIIKKQLKILINFSLININEI